MDVAYAFFVVVVVVFFFFFFHHQLHQGVGTALAHQRFDFNVPLSILRSLLTTWHHAAWIPIWSFIIKNYSISGKLMKII